MSLTSVTPELDALCVEFARILNVDSILPDATFSELGADSMAVVEVALAAEDIYETMIDLERLSVDGDVTLRGLHEQILGLKNES